MVLLLEAAVAGVCVATTEDTQDNEWFGFASVTTKLSTTGRI